MALFLILAVAALVLTLVGALAHGLFYLLVIGVIVFAFALVHLGRQWERRGMRRRTR